MDAEFAKRWGLDPDDVRPPTDSAPVKGISEADFAKRWGLDEEEVTPAGPLKITVRPAGTKGRPFIPDEEKKGQAAVLHQLFKGVPIAGAMYERANPRPDLDKIAEETPVQSGVAHFLGGVAGLGPVAATEMGAAALGLTGKNLLTRSLTGGATGAGIGLADAAIRSPDDPTRIAASGLVGGVTGGLAPAAGDLIGAGANRLLDLFRSPRDSAGRMILGGLGESGVTVQDLERSVVHNPRLTLMDADPNLLIRAQGIATQPGEGRKILSDAVTARAGSAADTVRQAYDTALGAAPDVKALLEGMKSTAKSNASRGFGDALKNAGPIDTAGLPADKLLATWDRVSRSFPDGGARFSPVEKAHLIQQELRRESDALSKSAVGSERLAARDVENVRQQLIDRIDQASGGKFRPAQKQFADDMQVEDAFHKGMGVFKNSGVESRPEYLSDWLKNATGAEADALRQGVRTAVDQQLRSVRNAALKGETLPAADFNREKLEIVLGKAETNRLLRTVRDERAIADANQKLMANSQTQPRAEGAKATAVRDIGPLAAEVGLPAFAAGLGNHWTAAGLVGAALAKRGLQYGLQAKDLARNADAARMLSASGPARDNVINYLIALSQQGERGAEIARRVGMGGNLLTNAAGQNLLTSR